MTCPVWNYWNAYAEAIFYAIFGSPTRVPITHLITNKSLVLTNMMSSIVLSPPGPERRASLGVGPGQVIKSITGAYPFKSYVN